MALKIRRREPVPGGDWPDGMSPLLRRLYAMRGAASREQAQPRLSALAAPHGLLGLERAVALLADAIDRDARIVVVGDFDCDGATACATGVRGLRLLGARHVAHAVPNRMVHGYGLSPALVDELAALQPEVLVTVDHGIACHAGIAAAKARGWTVVVTDHHLPGQTLPPADAIVDPSLPGDAFPSKALAGVGVMFYVLLALRAHLRRAGQFGDGAGPDMGVLLDLVTIGTVADLVPLDLNNRALVGAGLRRLRAGQGHAGVRALIRASGRDESTLSAADIGFAIGPRLNAAGRLEDMSLGIELLLCDEPAAARAMAEALEQINAERRAVQQVMTDDAEHAVARASLAAEGELPAALCLFDADWHPGVVGLVASKIKERLHRPTVAFAPADPDAEVPGAGTLRGSARSIPGFHVRDALAAIDAARPGLIERFGGHAMAAGMSLPAGHLEAFREAWHAHAAAHLDPALLQAELLTDGELLPQEFDRAHAELLRDAGPWGQGFPEPLFDGEFEVLDARAVGGRHLKLVLRHPGLREPLQAIRFGGWTGERTPGRVRLAYRLAPDDYRGGQAVQLLVEALQPAD